MKGGKIMVSQTKNKPETTEDYVAKAERVMRDLSKIITTSKIRDLLAQVNELYNDIILETDETLSQKHIEAIRHLKIKMIYDAGRDRQQTTRREIKDNPKLANGRITYFFNETGLLEMVENIGNSRTRFLEYCRYFEALVAYHKFYGGKE